MTPADVCRKCDGVGKILTPMAVERCPKCRGSGWDPEKVRAAGGDPDAIADKIYQILKPEPEKGSKYGRR